MNLELILWITAVIILSEAMFILWSIKNKTLDEDSFFRVDEWVIRKIICLLTGGFFMFIQYGVVLGFATFGEIRHYEYLLYEVLIVCGIAILFLINYLINKMINGVRNDNR